MKCVIYLWIYSIFILLLEFCGSNGVKIHSLHVPSSVENGTDSVILDCEYWVPTESLAGLVVKWSLNEKPIYQWIPPSPPQALGILRNRVDLSYRISEDKFQQHRALRILKPTTSISGDYTCRVATFQDEDFQSKKLIVFAPPKRLMLKQYITSSSEVNITCRAEVVYPSPQMELFLLQEKDSRSRVDGVTVQFFQKENGSYFDAVLYKLFFEKDLEAGSVFECSLVLPETEFSLRSDMVYFPGQSSVIEDDAYTSSSSSFAYYTSVHVLCCLLLIYYNNKDNC